MMSKYLYGNLISPEKSSEDLLENYLEYADFNDVSSMEYWKDNIYGIYDIRSCIGNDTICEKTGYFRDIIKEALLLEKFISPDKTRFGFIFPISRSKPRN